LGTGRSITLYLSSPLNVLERKMLRVMSSRRITQMVKRVCQETYRGLKSDSSMLPSYLDKISKPAATDAALLVVHADKQPVQTWKNYRI
jgi:hypothetical protein